MDFATLAAQYDAWYATPLGQWADQVETEAIMRMLALPAGAEILDLGVGTGRFALMAAQRGWRVTGIDTRQRCWRSPRHVVPHTLPNRLIWCVGRR